jgi:hypothetical protein
VYASWEQYLEAEQATARSWDTDIELMLRAKMREQDGRILPRVSTADQMIASLMAYHVDNLPVMSLPILLVVATLPEELANERERGTRSLRRCAPHLRVVHIEQAGHDLLVDKPAEVSRAVWDFCRTLG